MPIDYNQYHPKWSLISRLIRFKRAKNCCEKCGVKNGSIGYRDEKGVFHEWYLSEKYSMAQHKRFCWMKYGTKLIRIILTVAHVDRNKNNNRFDNLKALCQRCHLKHDIKQHCDNRKYGRDHKGSHQFKLEL